jgi:hypothetical protein
VDNELLIHRDRYRTACMHIYVCACVPNARSKVNKRKFVKGLWDCVVKKRVWRTEGEGDQNAFQPVAFWFITGTRRISRSLYVYVYIYVRNRVDGRKKILINGARKGVMEANALDLCVAHCKLGSGEKGYYFESHHVKSTHNRWSFVCR